MNDDRIRDLWNLGRSALEIARIVKSTRNAVMGRVSRMGLTDDTRAIHRKIVAKPKPPPLPEPEPEPEPLCIPIEEATYGQCRFPLWPHMGPLGDMPVCGLPMAQALPYCAAHARRCYTHRA